MNTEKARVASYNFAGTTLEFLHLPDGSFGIAASQFSKHFSLPTKHGSRKVKSLLGNDIPLPKVASELNSNKVTYLTLEQFELAATRLAFEGNKLAQAFVSDCVGLSLIQVAHDAFGIKYEVESRSRWTKFRAQHKKQYHKYLTRWLKADGCKSQKEYSKAVNIFKASAGLPIKSVDEYSEDELDALNIAELEYNMARKLGCSHLDAMKVL